MPDKIMGRGMRHNTAACQLRVSFVKFLPEFGQEPGSNGHSRAKRPNISVSLTSLIGAQRVVAHLIGATMGHRGRLRGALWAARGQLADVRQPTIALDCGEGSIYDTLML